MRYLRARWGLLIVLLFSATSGRASPEATPPARYEVSLQLGGAFAQLRDQNFGPTRYDGLLPGGALGFLARTDQDVFDFRIGAAGGTLENRYGYGALQIAPRLQFGWGRALLSGSERVRIEAGPAVDARPTLFQFLQEDPDHVNWSTAYSLSGRIAASIAVTPAWRLLVEGQLPLVALVSRPPGWVEYDSDKPDPAYLLGRVHHGLQLASWNRYQAAQVELGLEVEVSERLTHKIAWQLDFGRDALPRPVARLTQSLAFTWRYRL